jgi:hypothetical protein
MTLTDGDCDHKVTKWDGKTRRSSSRSYRGIIAVISRFHRGIIAEVLKTSSESVESLMMIAVSSRRYRVFIAVLSRFYRGSTALLCKNETTSIRRLNHSTPPSQTRCKRAIYVYGLWWHAPSLRATCAKVTPLVFTKTEVAALVLPVPTITFIPVQCSWHDVGS